MPKSFPNGWPQCVGKSGQQAEKIIKNDFPQAQTHILPQGSRVTCDYRLDRVRIYVNGSGKVASVPHAG